MQDVLVSGAAGYIGGFTADLLLERGYGVTVLDNLSTGHRDLIPADAKFVEADLTSHRDLLEKLSSGKFVGLIHFAAKALVGESVVNPDLYYNNNVFGSINLFQVARAIGIDRIIFSSTAAVYGEPVAELDEQHPKAPVNPYGDTKLTIENYLKAASRAYGLRAIALRYFNASGAKGDSSRGEIHKPETHLIPLVVGAALGIYPALNVFGNDYDTPDGSPVRDYIHVEDLAEAHLAALEFLGKKNDSYFDAFNLGTGKGHSVLEVIKIAEKVLKKKVPHKFSARREGDPAILVAKPSKANKVLGWQAKHTDLEKTISEVSIWMEKNRNRF